MQVAMHPEQLSAARRALLECWMHPGRNGAAALERKRLVAYVVPRNVVGSSDDDAVAEHVQRWGDVHDALYSEAGAKDRAFNTSGWVNSYDSAPIPETEMREWRDGTVRRILECQPDRVLEIGCGAGLLLFAIAPTSSYYLGTDISGAGLASVRAGCGLNNVELRQQPADDFTGIAPQSFDTVILNSVVQYFPGVRYLMRVLEGAWRALRPGGRLFLGDIRNLDLLETFHLTVALHRASRVETAEALRRTVKNAVRDERELVLAPRFFDAIAATLPDVTGIEVQPRRGRASNELTRFRYDVVAQRGGESPSAVPALELDWAEGNWNTDSFCRWLHTEAPQRALVRGVPAAKLVQATSWSELLSRREGAATAGELTDTPAPVTGVEVEDLAVAGYDLRLRWSERPGAYDVLLRRSAASLCLDEPRRVEGSPQQYANDPLRGVRLQQLGERLRRYAHEVLPAHMAPSAFVFVDELPKSANGKIDRRALAAQDVTRPSTDKLHQEPRNEVESGIARIWEEVLGCRRVGVTDNFFELGGHSLLATQLISRVRRAFAVEISLRSLFEAPTIEAQARLVEDLLIREIEGLDEAEAQQLAEDAP